MNTNAAQAKQATCAQPGLVAAQNRRQSDPFRPARELGIRPRGQAGASCPAGRCVSFRRAAPLFRAESCRCDEPRVVAAARRGDAAPAGHPAPRRVMRGPFLPEANLPGLRPRPFSRGV